MEGTTFRDYWSLPSIQTFEKITHWMPKPLPPANEALSEMKAIMIEWIMAMSEQETLEHFKNAAPKLEKFFG